MGEVILFDQDEVEHLASVSDCPSQIDGSKLLWIDVRRGSESEAAEVADAFALAEQTRRRLEQADDRPAFDDRGRYIHLTTYAPRDDDLRQLHAIECVVGESWVITAHDQPIPVLEEFRDRVSGSGDTGSLDGPGFLAALLEWVLGSYTNAFEAMEQRLEDFDVDAMRGKGAEQDIEQLVEMRRTVGELRRALSAHRSALVALAHPELEALADHHSGRRFEALFQRFEATLEESRDVRESIVGSFDVLIARGGHQTNEIMKILTLTSVILLPGALLAGVMGMNFKLGFFDHPGMFWVVLAVIVSFAPITFLVAKHQRWI